MTKPCAHVMVALPRVCPDPTACRCPWHGGVVGKRCSRCGHTVMRPDATAEDRAYWLEDHGGDANKMVAETRHG